jgi:hypothetical protein
VILDRIAASVTSSVRTSLHAAISSKVGEGFPPIAFPRSLARRLNVTLGQPLCSKEELATRRAAEAKLKALRARSASDAKRVATEGARVAAPVLVYFEKGRNPRELARIEELLKAKAIDYQLLDVTGDEATLTFVTRAVGCKDDELPVVFVASSPVGAYPKLVEADVSGELAKKVYG